MALAQIPEPHGDYTELIKTLWANIHTIPGVVAEFGVFRGGTTRRIADITGRSVYAFDTYTGIPKEDFGATLDSDNPGLFQPEHIAEVLFEDRPDIQPVVGRFADTLAEFVPSDKLVFVYIDCDLYMSAKQVLDWLPEHLVDGAIVLFDDYKTHKGIAKAVNEFCEKHKINKVAGDKSSVYIKWKDN